MGVARNGIKGGGALVATALQLFTLYEEKTMAARTVLLLASLCIIAHLITSELAKYVAAHVCRCL